MVKIDTQVSEKILTAAITAVGIEAPAKYACYLYRGDEIIAKSGYQKENEFFFPLESAGIYHVRGFIRWPKAGGSGYERQAANGKPLSFFPGISAEYEKFLKTTKEMSFPELPFVKLASPKQDFLVLVNSTDVPRSLDALAARLTLKTTQLAPCVTLFSELEPLHQDGRYVLFSGMGRTDGRLVVGMEDVDSLATADALSEQVGTFCLLRADQHTLTMETDYLGMEKLYYYRDSNICLISSRVHLIILAMKELGIARRPNMPRIYTTLTHMILTRQNFCQEMNIEGLIALRADSRLKVSLDNLDIQAEKSSLHTALSQYIPYDEMKFRTLLKRAADEIVDNLRIALEHPAFDKFILHLTGGMDSRTVLCALSRLPDRYRNKVIAKTVKTQIVGDFEIPMKLLSKFRLPFGGIPLKEGVPYNPEWKMEELSTGLGCTSESGKFLDPEHLLPGDRVCMLPGAAGDALARSHYSTGHFDRPLDDSTLSDRAYSERLLKVFAHRKAIFQAPAEMRQTLVMECMTLPGISNLNKYDNHYIFYRNGLHFNTAYDYRPFAPSWAVLQSKTLLLLKVMTFPLKFNSRLELELLYELNPELASVEYSSEKYNMLRRELDAKYHRYPTCTQFDEALIEEIKQDWEENEQQRMLRQKSNSQQKSELTLFSTQGSLQVLYTLITRLNLREDAGAALYSFLVHQNDREKGNVIRKIISLYYELY